MTDQDIAVSLAINAGLSLIPAIVAKRKGYPFVGWWLLGCFFTWIVMLVVAIFVRRRLPPEMMPCPACGNGVSLQAASCPKCGHPLLPFPTR